MVSHTFNFFLQDVQLPGALGIARPAQRPTRAPIGFPPPPRASQGAHALPSGQLELRADPGRAPSRRAAQFDFQADARAPSPGRYSRNRGRVASRLPSRSRTPIARRRRLPVSAPPGSWQPSDPPPSFGSSSIPFWTVHPLKWS